MDKNNIVWFECNINLLNFILLFSNNLYAIIYYIWFFKYIQQVYKHKVVIIKCWVLQNFQCSARWCQHFWDLRNVTSCFLSMYFALGIILTLTFSKNHSTNTLKKASPVIPGFRIAFYFSMYHNVMILFASLVTYFFFPMSFNRQGSICQKVSCNYCSL